MKRLIINKLNDWKNSGAKKPLIINGARQIGKTYTMIEFARNQYDNYIYLNFESDSSLDSIFERDYNISRIITELEALYGKQIIEERTLIIFDEIQASKHALTTLKYFNENNSSYHVISAGSLLGVALNKNKISFPVGKVDMIDMYPLNFKEFLLALNENQLLSQIEKSFITNTPLSKALHEKALDLVSQFLVVGGMPEAVSNYVLNKDYDLVRVIQKGINASYSSDMSKYSTDVETIKTKAVYDSIPSQLAKENKKFQYNMIKSGARASQYEASLEWLDKSGIIYTCYKINEPKHPIEMSKNITSYKVYLSDVGLLTAKINLNHNIILGNQEMLSSTAKGAIYENYVATELKMKNYNLYYYESEGKSEIDFIIQKEGLILPVEVKSSDNVKAKSLLVYTNRFKPEYSIKVTSKNFGFENGIKNIPHYALFNI
ncbi:similar to ATPase [Alteracholeplasma palmae J233]|uniref:Similar to ATPase n=1 Tax=Alteracholeplasma palmae (strain ATCC 49389 / J233) TaxID=1318466 RepID=U4KJJ3_ALTPJ|nr:AAA family ATPase [Alteracholeplasma palmae]CCV63614.1 similar to ATPase [Alteracholeplasma palmae J233]